MKVADSSTGTNFGMGMWVDWYTLCQSWIWKNQNPPITNCTRINYCYCQSKWVNPDLCPEETVALLLHIVVDDARHFLLPDFKAIDADIVLDVLERPVKSVHGGSHLLQLGHKFTGLRKKFKFSRVFVSAAVTFDAYRAEKPTI